MVSRLLRVACQGARPRDPSFCAWMVASHCLHPHLRQAPTTPLELPGVPRRRSCAHPPVAVRVSPGRCATWAAHSATQLNCF